MGTSDTKSADDGLLERAGIPAAVAAKVRARQREGKTLSEALQEVEDIEPAAWARVLAEMSNIPFAERLSGEQADPELVGRVPIHYAKRHQLLPLRRTERAVVAAVADPRETGPLDDLRLLYGLPIDPVVAPAPAILEAINRAYDVASGSAAAMIDDLDTDGLDRIATELEEPRDLLEAADEAPVIRLVNSLISQAVKDRASDIHIEPFERDLVVRFRVDGILYDVLTPPKRFQPAVVSRVKIMAGLNIAEKRLPHDGRIRLKIAGRDVDIRVSIVPTAFGERVVLRLLDRSAALLPLEELGLTGRNLRLVDRLICQSHGIILVTGPTGSGKTTTLYAALSKINAPDKNIITIEDPIEYQLHGIGQIQVNPRIGLTFAGGLRAILRQDPDVILVGEIRDVETAEIAIQAALTGHLVFSTLHTNDSFGAVSRLLDMGAEPFLVSSSVTAVMAQRLVRRLCPGCRTPTVPPSGALEELGLDPESLAHRPVYGPGPGCAECKQTGYRGRTGIHELLVVNDQIRNLVMQRADAAAIRRAAVTSGMPLLRADGVTKVLEGTTAIEEVLRVTQEDLDLDG